MDLGLKDRVALVCGASKGLGKAVALGLAREGARLAICSRNLENIQQAAEEIRKGHRDGGSPPDGRFVVLRGGPTFFP